MTVFPQQINDVMHLYNRLSKLKMSTILKKDETELQDTVRVSTQVKRRQILDQT